MSIFKNHKTIADRSATDRSRHKAKIERAIREGIHDIVSDESIIGQDGKKRIKIPVRGIKEYRFVYGSNESNRKVASAPGHNVKKGQKVGSIKSKNKGNGDRAGNKPGEEFYEVEITLDELASYLFDSLKLPDLDKKTFKNILENKFKRSGYRKKGIRPRLSKKKTIQNKIRRKKILERVLSSSIEENDKEHLKRERFPFHENDLTYNHIKASPKENANAVIFFIMDVSGSMTQEKKFMARSFFFLLYHFLHYKYDSVEIVFISHTTEAKEVSEDSFFTRGSSGGTILSSGIEKCLEIINKRFHPHSWNIYSFHCSDGDNWPSDINKSIDLSNNLRDICQMYCYIQIMKDSFQTWENGGMSRHYEPYAKENFKIIQLESKEDIWPEFKRIFKGDF